MTEKTNPKHLTRPRPGLLIGLLALLCLAPGTQAMDFQAAQEALEANQLDQALLIYEYLAAQAGSHHDSTRAWFHHGQVLIRLNRIKEAILSLKAARDLAQRHDLTQLELYSRLQLAIAQNLAGNPALAREELGNLLEDPRVMVTDPLALKIRLEALKLADESTLKSRLVADLVTMITQSPRLVESELATLKKILRDLSAGDEPDLSLDLLAPLRAIGRLAPEEALLIEARALAGRGELQKALERLAASTEPELILLKAELLVKAGHRAEALAELTKRVPNLNDEARARLAGQAGRIALELGLYSEAGRLLELGMASRDPQIRSQALADGASLALAAGDYQTAIRRLKDSGARSEPALRLLATALIAAGEPQEAEDLLSATEDDPGLALLKAQIRAQTAVDPASQAEARDLASEALRLAREKNDSARLAWSAILLARFLPEEAEQVLSEALLEAWRAGETRAEAIALHDLGLSALRAGLPGLAEERLARAARIFESFTRPWGREERLYSAADRAGTRRHQALALLLQEKTEEAWSAFEDSLAGQVRETRALVGSKSPDFEDGTLQQKPKTNHNPIELKALQSDLAKTGSLVAAYLTWEDDKPGVVFLIGPESLRAYELPASDWIKNKANQFTRLAARPLIERVWDASVLGTRVVDRRADYLKLGGEIRASLLTPLEGLVKESGLTNLIIIADGSLAGLPFAAIPLNESEALGEVYPLANPVSATVWSQALKEEPESQRLVLIGDTGERQIADGRIFADLPGTQIELALIAGLYRETPAILLRGEEAGPVNLSAALNPSAPAILHLATHGFFMVDRLDGRERGGLLLAGPGKSGAVLDERVIAGLNLRGTQVTLSACETAQGEAILGEGMRSLMRAFLSAGARGVTASLWQIGDRATTEYMASYYANLKSGLTPAQAHRATRVKLRRSGFWPSQRSAFISSN